MPGQDQTRSRVPAQGRSRSVDPAHPVDRYLFHQGLGDEFGVCVGLLVRLHDVAFRYWGLDKSGRSGENLRQDMASSARMEGRAGMLQETRVGRRRSTTPQHITDVALRLFADSGFAEVSVDDVAQAAGIARRTVFRYYASKNAIPWGDFDAHLQHLRELLEHLDPGMSLGEALRAALLSFNTFDESETIRHRQRMRVILQTAELQAYSMTMYAGWREVIAEFVARRSGVRTTDLVPQTVAWTLLGVALSAYEYWLEDETVSLPQALGDAFDVVRAGLDGVAQ
jgi:TetR/AcrR family transcriptional regulator, regulator of mycofactocin system